MFQELESRGELSCTYVRDLLEKFHQFDPAEKLGSSSHGVINYPNKTLIHFKREIRGRKSVKLFVMQMIENLMNWKKPGV